MTYDDDVSKVGQDTYFLLYRVRSFPPSIEKRYLTPDKGHVGILIKLLNNVV